MEEEAKIKQHSPSPLINITKMKDINRERKKIERSGCQMTRKIISAEGAYIDNSREEGKSQRNRGN